MFDHLSGLTDKDQVERAVAELIAPYGQIETLHIFEPLEHGNQRILLITMSSTEQANSAKNALGIPSFGHNSLVITLPVPNTP